MTKNNNNMLKSLIFFSFIFMTFRAKVASENISKPKPDDIQLGAPVSPPPTGDGPPMSCQNFKGRDTRDPLLNVPSFWRPSYATNDPCWSPEDDKNCSVAEHVFDPDGGLQSYTFTCLGCTVHVQSGSSGSSSHFFCG